MVTQNNAQVEFNDNMMNCSRIGSFTFKHLVITSIMNFYFYFMVDVLMKFEREV